MTIDLTGVAVSVIAGIFAILGTVLPLLINARMKDAQAAATLSAAVKNSLGAMQQAADAAVQGVKPNITIPATAGVPPEFSIGVQYVLDHAGEEAARFGITPAAIADKISAQVGLVKVQASAAPPDAAAIAGPTSTK